jgi:hypothetical protein
MLSWLLLVLVAADPMPNYPDPRFIDPSDPTINVGMTVCPWLNHIAMKMNFTSIDPARAAANTALDSLNTSEWADLRIPTSMIDKIKANFTQTPCAFEPEKYQDDENFRWHPWSVGDMCLDGPSAAPLNHKVIADNANARLLNVYAPALTLEVSTTAAWL